MNDPTNLMTLLCVMCAVIITSTSISCMVSFMVRGSVGLSNLAVYLFLSTVVSIVFIVIPSVVSGQ